MNNTTSGLADVVAATTRLSHVDGAAGRLLIAGYSVEELAPFVSFEQLVFLLRNDRLPSAAEERELAAALAAHRDLTEPTLAALRTAADAGAQPIDAVRLGLCSLAAQAREPLDAWTVIGSLPFLLAAWVRLQNGQSVVRVPERLGHAAAFLYALRGDPASSRHVRALNTYWNTVSDHGLNASTFTARVIASTGSDLASCIEGALGALKGPLHGGAPGPALDALLRLIELGPDLEQHTRQWVEAELAAGRRIMGFGHRVYRVRDPRADVLGAAASELLAETELYAAARVHERVVLETLARLKPGRALATNVEFYTALLLHGLGLPSELFSAVFALGRSAGWTAHVEEQVASGRLIRPRAKYEGASARTLPMG